ncbi:hypothetical protein G7046_g4866 [Stylonectria norvegica]|nr:hypothetical protein G7046_g4866 [Stylonectria norvegica]
MQRPTYRERPRPRQALIGISMDVVRPCEALLGPAGMDLLAISHLSILRRAAVCSVQCDGAGGRRKHPWRAMAAGARLVGLVAVGSIGSLGSRIAASQQDAHPPHKARRKPRVFADSALAQLHPHEQPRSEFPPIYLGWLSSSASSLAPAHSETNCYVLRSALIRGSRTGGGTLGIQAIADMASLPSYHKATVRTDWLQLVAPYIAFGDYPALCRVNRRFWGIVAPLVWADVIKSARRTGLDPVNDLEWWFDFVFDNLNRTNATTRSLVRVLDARGFANDPYHFALVQGGRNIQESFKRALELLPRVSCVVLDDHTNVAPGRLLTGITTEGKERLPLLLFSLADCRNPPANAFLGSNALQGLIYLDVSGIPGSINDVFSPGVLPELRILKIRNRSIRDLDLNVLLSCFGTQLWSLDLSKNELTDSITDAMGDKCSHPVDLRAQGHFRVEGGLKLPPVLGRDFKGYRTIRESEHSGSFNHPERYLVDPPQYTGASENEPQRHQLSRWDGSGNSPMKSDSVDALVQKFSDKDHADWENVYRDSKGLSHLHISKNRITHLGIENLMRTFKGQLEVLSCDSMPLVGERDLDPHIWPKGAKLYGSLGLAYAFRPVVAANIRALRLHHSFVTQIPTLESRELSTLSRLYLAETTVLCRSTNAYPQSFAPDMNPRLTSLTLTHIPRRSSGPLINNLITFLKLLSAQERQIQHLEASWRSGSLVKGLRHLRLEFDDLDLSTRDNSSLQDFEAKEFMQTKGGIFSFFDGESGADSSSAYPSRTLDPLNTTSSGRNASSSQENGKAMEDTFLQPDGKFVLHHGTDVPFPVPVWVGATSPSPNPVINDYERLVLKHSLRKGLGPVTPPQVLAGAPEDIFIYHTAWRAAIMPPELTPPSTRDTANMKDVLEELKKFRQASKAAYEISRGQGRAPVMNEEHSFWTGDLQVSMAHG